ncbi:MAG: hypothetical protein HY245_02500 [Rhizobiales bacterium]|nr:hypothetical protein [Hyphomicrobiales bacterium]
MQLPRALSRTALLAFIGLAISACSFGGGGGGGTGPDITAGPSVMSAVQIRDVLSGKSWKFTGPNNTGTTLYAADGSSLVEVDGKGTTKGKWQTQDGQLCESFEPAKFLPGVVPMSCYPFSARGDGSYQAGKAVFTLAN